MIKLNYFCVVEGQQEKMYLEHISSLLRDFPKRSVSFNIKIGNAGELKKFLSRSANSAKEYVNDVRDVYALSKEADIKSRDTMGKILKQITLDDVKTAILNAERICNDKTEKDKLYIDDTYYYHDPDFSIHIFLKKVLEKSGIDIHIKDNV